MKNKLGNLCMSLGAVLMVAALSLCFINQWENDQAGNQAEEVVNKLEQRIQTPQTHPPESSGTDGTVPEPSYPDPFDPVMTEVEIDGYLYIGTVDIPSLDLSLPVMSEWDYSRLKIAPCRYTGSTKTDDLVIAAHNYTRHFGQLKNLSEGDSVFFTDMDGVVSEYAVAAIEVLPPTAVEDMNAGDYDLTLFTCTYGGASRVTVRCDRVENERK